MNAKPKVLLPPESCYNAMRLAPHQSSAVGSASCVTVATSARRSLRGLTLCPRVMVAAVGKTSATGSEVAHHMMLWYLLSVRWKARRVLSLASTRRVRLVRSSQDLPWAHRASVSDLEDVMSWLRLPFPAPSLRPFQPILVTRFHDCAKRRTAGGPTSAAGRGSTTC